MKRQDTKRRGYAVRFKSDRRGKKADRRNGKREARQ